MILTRTAAAALLGTMLSTAAWAASDGPVRSVTLSSGGLAELVREAKVDGSSTVEIEVPLDQVDDVLKSLVVLDRGGTVRGISLAGPSPVEETFKTLPFNSSDLASLPTLLSAIQGTEVTVSSDGETVTGDVLGVETRNRGEGETLPLLTVLSRDGRILTLRLADDAAVTVEDESMRRKIADAVTVTGEGRADGSRTVSIGVDGKGARKVGISYVVAAPVWKTAYRTVVLPDGKARLQAWAVLENASGEDWKDVSITLSSGEPVTLKQRLHDRYWRERPEVPIASSAASAPEADTGTLSARLARAADGSGASLRPLMEKSVAAAAPAPAMAMDAVQGEMEFSSATDTGMSAEGDVTATFELPGTYDVPNGGTLSVPIADAEIPAEMVSVYRSGQPEPHPVAAVMLENSTGVSLPAGILTVYGDGGSYVGDAQLLGFPAKDSRLASFASDRKVTVVQETRHDGGAVRISVSDGMLHATLKDRSVTTYKVSGALDAERTVVIEHPRMEGWQFASEASDGETATHHRMKVAIPAGGAAEAVAVQEILRSEAYALTNVDPGFLLSMTGKAEPEVAEALKGLAAAQSQRADAERRMERLASEIADAERTQKRIRENLAAVPDGDRQLQGTYVDRLAQTEDRISEMEARREEARKALAAAEEKVGQAIKAF